MIDEKEILPFNFFSYGGVYSGDHNGMRYMIKRTGKKPDFTLNALVWRGPYASSAVNADDITKKKFEYSEEGRKAAIEWIQKMYTDRKDEWDNAHPSIRLYCTMAGRIHNDKYNNIYKA